MKLLLDTHALLWWLADDKKLSAPARKAIASPSNQVYVSAVSGWEISIKQALGRLDVDTSLLMSEVENNGFMLLNIRGCPEFCVNGQPGGVFHLTQRREYDRFNIIRRAA